MESLFNIGVDYFSIVGEICWPDLEESCDGLSFILGIIQFIKQVSMVFISFLC